MSNKTIANDQIFKQIKNLLNSAKNKIVTSINTQMVQTYFEIGKIIVEHEQHGKEKAQYGKAILKELSIKLTNEFGKGFSLTNLKAFRSFYLVYSKSQTVSDQFKLSWSHYVSLVKLDDLSRKFMKLRQ